jgi:CheY-like chemotaxis protein
MSAGVEVLYVEDSAGDALLTGQILADALLPVKLTIARDGAQALTMLANPAFAPAMIILDLSLPLVSGFDVLARNWRKDIPVVVFTASTNQADLDRALDLGAVASVQKPMDLHAYRDAVLAMIDMWASPGNDADSAAAP